MMETQTLVFRAEEQGRAAVATALGDPSITLVENGPALGFLIAESCHQDSYSEKLYLDRVLWVRGDDQVRAVRDFPEVCLCRTESGFWIAEETSTGKLFPQPSPKPYRVFFIREAEYRTLQERRSLGAVRDVLTAAKARFGPLPAFRDYKHLSKDYVLKARAALVNERGYISDRND